MAKKKNVEARASKLVNVIAKKLGQDQSILSPEKSEQLVRRAASDLPEGELRTAIENDFARFASLLREAVSQEINAPEAAKIKDAKSLERLLTVAKGPIFTNATFKTAADAVVTGAEKGAGKGGESREWVASCRRLLASRSSVPLGLWWTYVGLELQGSSEKQELTTVRLKTLVPLMDRLKALHAGHVDGYTAVASLAPVVTCMYHGIVKLSSGSGTPSKSWRKDAKALKSMVEYVLKLVAVSRLNSMKTPKVEEMEVDARGLMLASRAVSEFTGVTLEGTPLSKVFPLSPEEIRKSSTMVARSSEFWAALVSMEAVLMTLLVTMVEHRGKGNVTESFEELKLLAVCKTSILRSDFLLDLLIEPSFSFSGVLSSEEEVVLRKVLYEVTLFDLPAYGKNTPGASKKAFATYLKKVILYRRANEFYRSHGERTKASEIASRVSMLNIPHGFLEWSRRNALPEDVLKNPQRFTAWLAQTADNSLLVKLLTKVSPGQSDVQTPLAEAKNEAEDDMFFVDIKLEKVSAEQAFVAAAEEMNREGAEHHPYDAAAAAESSDDDEEEEGSDPPEELHTTVTDPSKESVEADMGADLKVVVSEMQIDEELNPPIEEDAVATQEDDTDGEVQMVVEAQEEPEARIQEEPEDTEAGTQEAEEDVPMVEAQVEPPEEEKASEVVQAEVETAKESEDEVIVLENGVNQPDENQQDEEVKQAQPAATPRRGRPRKGSRPPVEVPSTPQAAPKDDGNSVLRCTRSGRKYSNYTAPVTTAESARKKRRL